MSQGDAQSGWGLGLFRRQNEESLLALAGKQQGVLRWGRVMENGLMLDGYARWGIWKTSASLTLARLEGVGIEANDQLSLYARLLRPIPGHTGLEWGPELYVTTFRRDLDGYGPGQGGYFSPALHAKLGGRLELDRNIGTWRWQGNLGLGWAVTERRQYSGNRGWAGQLELEGSTKLGRDWRFGLQLAGRTSPDYEDWQAGLVLHLMR